jgi:hypothetical protein
MHTGTAGDRLNRRRLEASFDQKYSCRLESSLVNAGVTGPPSRR